MTSRSTVERVSQGSTRRAGGIESLETRKVTLPEGQPFRPANVLDVPGTEGIRTDFEAVVVAIGMKSASLRQDLAGNILRRRRQTWADDCRGGCGIRKECGT